MAAFNLGISVGPWLGGTLLDAGASYRVLPLAGAGLAAIAATLAALDAVSARRVRPVPDARAECLTGA